MSENASSKADDVGAVSAGSSGERDLDALVILNVLLAGAAAALAICIGWTLLAFVTEMKLAFIALLVGPAVGAAAWSVAKRPTLFVVTSSLLLTLLGVGVGYLMVQYYAGSQIEADRLAKDETVVVRLLLVRKMARKGVVPEDVRRYYLSEDFGLESQVEMSPRLGRQVANLRAQTHQQVEEMSPAERRKLVGDRLERLWKDNGAWLQMLRFEGLDYAWLGGSVFLALMFGLGFFAKEEDEEVGEVPEQVPLAAEPPRAAEDVTSEAGEVGSDEAAQVGADEPDVVDSDVGESDLLEPDILEPEVGETGVGDTEGEGSEPMAPVEDPTEGEDGFDLAPDRRNQDDE